MHNRCLPSLPGRVPMAAAAAAAAAAAKLSSCQQECGNCKLNFACLIVARCAGSLVDGQAKQAPLRENGGHLEAGRPADRPCSLPWPAADVLSSWAIRGLPLPQFGHARRRARSHLFAPKPHPVLHCFFGRRNISSARPTWVAHI